MQHKIRFTSDAPIPLMQAKALWLYCGLVAQGYELVNNKIVRETK